MLVQYKRTSSSCHVTCSCHIDEKLTSDNNDSLTFLEKKISCLEFYKYHACWYLQSKGKQIYFPADFILNDMIVFCCQASLDEPTHTVVMHRTEPTRLQSLALQLSEKVSSLVDNNEKIMEFKQGNYFQKNSKLFLLAARFVVVHLCPPFNYLLS